MTGSGRWTDGLRAICWGSRGSIPAPGPETVAFGGNTSCLEVQGPGGTTLVFDAGTGIRQLGSRLAGAGEPARVDLFLTHFHWDHVQGLPWFAPLMREEASIRVHGPGRDGREVRRRIAGLWKAPYFPFALDVLPARLDVSPTAPGDGMEVGGAEIDVVRLRHPSLTLGYRVRLGDRSIAYLPDNELVGGDYPLPPGTGRQLRRFLEGVDLLVHDAMFTAEEYAGRQGWGHSTFDQAVRLAEESGVGRVAFFHHAPERTDAELTRILEGIREELDGRGSTLSVCMATEGHDLLGREVCA